MGDIKDNEKARGKELGPALPAIQRYSIGYYSDEWGVRSLSPTGIYDDAGPWVLYGDHAAALAAGQAVVQDDLITIRKPTTRAEMLWLLKLAHLVISDVNKTLEETFAPAQELRESFTAADMASAAAQGFRDGVASVAANAGEPFGWVKQSEIDNSKQFGGSINLWRRRYDCDVPVYLAAPPDSQPALDHDRINELSCEMVKGNKSVNWLVSKIEAEVRKDDTELIQQLVEALENSSDLVFKNPRKADARDEAITAGRARLAD